MIFEGGGALKTAEWPKPEPGPRQVLIRVQACGVCRTDLHIVDGDLVPPRLPVIPGHQIVGVVEQTGTEVSRFQIGGRVGVPWLGYTCGECRYCRSGRENLCDAAQFTGLHINGGYAEYTVADERFTFSIPEGYATLQAAPLLCAGLIGYRSLRMAGDAHTLGFFGFGSAAHVIVQAARFKGQKIFAFTRPGDTEGQRFALELGADWAGDSTATPPEPLDAAIIFAPAGELVPIALKALNKGGTVVCAGIHMSDIPSFPYEILWGERSIRSVANLTRADGEEFLELAPRIPIRTQVQVWPLQEANEALNALREGRVHGSAVLKVSDE
jgi:propanol-preferring alcohol dehydrogenase